jgi:hypothetical protein
MTEKPIEDVAQDVLPEDEPDPEEYHADDDTVSGDTGTAYDVTGAPDATPQDEEFEAEPGE